MCDVTWSPGTVQQDALPHEQRGPRDMAGACDPASGRPRTLPRDLIQMAPDAPEGPDSDGPGHPEGPQIQMAPDALEVPQIQMARDTPKGPQIQMAMDAPRGLRFRWP